MVVEIARKTNKDRANLRSNSNRYITQVLKPKHQVPFLKVLHLLKVWYCSITGNFKASRTADCTNVIWVPRLLWMPIPTINT